MRTMGFINTGITHEKTPTTVKPIGHSLTIGSTGCGKTTGVIRSLMQQAIDGNASLLVVDEKNLLHLDLKYLAKNAMKDVYQLGGIAQGSNDLKINLLSMLKTKKQFKKFADDLMDVSRTGDNHLFWAKSASAMLCDIYACLYGIKELMIYAQRNLVQTDLVYRNAIDISLYSKKQNPITTKQHFELKFRAEPLTLKELFFYFNNRLAFIILSKHINEINENIRELILKNTPRQMKIKHLEALDRLNTRLEQASRKLSKWQISEDNNGDSSGNNGVYFTVGSNLGELAEISCINEVEGDNILALLEYGKHLVINSESLPTQAVSILISRCLDILSLRAKRRNIQPVSVIIDEAARIIDENTQLHTDFLRQAQVSVHIAIQHESQLIAKLGTSYWKTLETNFNDIYTMSTHDNPLEAFKCHSKKEDSYLTLSPIFFTRKALMQCEFKYQHDTNQYQSYFCEQGKVVVYDARIYEQNEEVILVDKDTLNESLATYFIKKEANGFFMSRVDCDFEDSIAQDSLFGFVV